MTELIPPSGSSAAPHAADGALPESPPVSHRSRLARTDRSQPPLYLWLAPLLLVVPLIVAVDMRFGYAVTVPAWLSAGLAGLACAHLVAVAVLPLTRRSGSVGAQLGSLATCAAGAAFGARWAGADVRVVAGWTAATALISVVGLARRRTFYASIQVIATYVGFVVVSAVWGPLFLASLNVSVVTAVLLWTAAIFAAVCLPSSVVQSYEAWEVIVRRAWRRPRLPAVPLDGTEPFVMVHVPVHAEPPEVVTATLDRLAALDYTNYRVLVIDNNTDDERLWRPVEEHCRTLGPQFEFLHLMGVAGAKAGALNEALQRTPEHVDLVALVDSDYQVRADWLKRTVGHFDDPRIGFVQCPHAYRDFEGSRFGRMANDEYSVFFQTSMVAYNERDAALTVGTMSLLRREVLQRVGGWAEWCLTEDSEVAVRIHDAGFSSVYLTEPMGRGLIPETFAAYRLQRFRWTYGPVQELRAHQKRFLPGRTGKLSFGQVVHHGNHGIDAALTGLRFLTIPISFAAALSMIAANEIVPVPLALWIAATAIITSSMLMRLAVLRAVLDAGVGRALASVLAYLSLTYVIQTASLRALLGIPAPWKRTSKFRAQHHRAGAIAAARAEIIAGVSALACAAVGLAALPHQGVAMMLLIGVALMGLTYLTSPIVALLADHDIKQALPHEANKMTPPARRRDSR